MSRVWLQRCTSETPRRLPVPRNGASELPGKSFIEVPLSRNLRFLSKRSLGERQQLGPGIDRAVKRAVTRHGGRMGNDAPRIWSIFRRIAAAILHRWSIIRILDVLTPEYRSFYANGRAVCILEDCQRHASHRRGGGWNLIVREFGLPFSRTVIRLWVFPRFNYRFSVGVIGPKSTGRCSSRQRVRTR